MLWDLDNSGAERLLHGRRDGIVAALDVGRELVGQGVAVTGLAQVIEQVYKCIYKCITCVKYIFLYCDLDKPSKVMVKVGASRCFEAHFHFERSV